MNCTTANSTSSSVLPDIVLPDALPNCPDVRAIKNVRVAIHFLLKTNPSNEMIKDDCSSLPNPPLYTYFGVGNFTESNDGNGSSATNGYLRAKDIVKYANDELEKNATAWRKSPNINYPSVAPVIPIRYILVGTFFHRDNANYSNPSLTSIHKKYDYMEDKVIDIYYAPKYTDGGGEALNIGGKDKAVLNGDYFTYVRNCTKDWSIIFSGSLLNHEIGHMCGLQHTWDEDDKCVDTPRGFEYNPSSIVVPPCNPNLNANCWSKDDTKIGCPKPCNDWSKVSNNVMDYNQYTPHAFTECQVERINLDIITAGQTYIESCKGCVPANAFFTINKTHRICEFKNPLIFNGQGSFNEDNYEISICEVTLKDPDKCIFSQSFSTGVIKGQAPKVDLTTMYQFLPNKLYKVTLTVSKEGCVPSSTTSEIVQTLGCKTVVDCCDIEFRTQNPFGNSIFIKYEAAADVQIESIQLVHTITGATFSLSGIISINAGTDELDFDTNEVPSGMYTLIIKYNEQYFFKSLIKFE